MKKLYSLFAVILLAALCAPAAAAEEWSWDWPVTASQDSKDKNGYINGFYNFSTTYDATITSMERTFNGKKWTVHFDAGAQLAYTSSGQSVGSVSKPTGTFSFDSDAFDGTITSATIQLKTRSTGATVKFSVGGVSYLCGGVAAAPVNSDNALHEYTFVPGEGGAQSGVVEFFVDQSADAAVATYTKKLAITYEPVQSAVAMPVFTPAAGTFDAPVQVSIAAAEGATVLYTLDGSSPRTEGNAATKTYDAPFTLDATATVKAVAKSGDDFSAVAEAVYVIRKSPGLSLFKSDFTIELLEEDIMLIDNPHNVAPITYSSSSPYIAYCDKNGSIFTYALGETVITASFAGNDEYLPQTLTANIKVVAKEPVTGFTVTPESGSYNGSVNVSVSCTDPRVETIWYWVSDKPAELDDLGMLEYGQYEINPSTNMTLTLDHSCVLSVQAVGVNLWSEPKFLTYEINQPLKAAFEATADNYEVLYHNGFDSDTEAAEWDFSSGSAWQLSGKEPFRGTPAFSAINPDSKYSLYHAYASGGAVVTASSPEMVVPEDGKVRFYAVFNPVWVIYGNLQLYVCETTPDAVPVKVWDAFLTSQEAATDDIKWNQYYVDLAAYAGKEVFFTFAYELDNGDDVFVDDFELVAPKPATDVITISVGDTVEFRDLSTGEPESWAWTFPGSEQATSAEQHPKVTYNTAGTFDVSLTVARGSETSSAERKAYVKVSPVAPTASIATPAGVYCSPEAGIVVPLHTDITFADASKGAPTSWSWTLPGTDLQSSSDRDVTVRYTAEGMYDVDLTVANEVGSSSTYIYGVKAGGQSLIWNIPAAYNDALAIISLSWYGNYGGTNWLDMEAFAEKFEAPAAKAVISGVNIYFASVEHTSADAPLTVSVAEVGADGMPGAVLASTSLKVSELVDASQTYNDPTWFEFESPVSTERAFFVTVAGFPNKEGDNIAMYALRRAETDGVNTAYHRISDLDDNYAPTGTATWYAQTDDATSFAIAPRIEFDVVVDGISDIEAADPDAPAVYYNLQGIRVDGSNLAPGIYIRHRAGRSAKILVK